MATGRIEPGQALALGLVIVLLVLVAAAYYWYHGTGWAKFGFKGTIPYAIGAACDANPPAGSTTCPSGKTCCPAGQLCGGASCATPCSTNNDCAGAGGACAGGVCHTGVVPSWTAAGGQNISALRFKNCVFTVVDPQGQTHTADETSVLNGMAVAYRGATSAVPASLYLDRPLNAFSFKLAGVNDSATVPTAAAAAAWAGSATALAGESRTI
jgi:hypothetical protein